MEDEITAKLETQNLITAWAEKKGLEPTHLLDVRLGARTDLGMVRENNEDKFDFFQPEDLPVLAAKGLFYAVADGMGGHASGQIASELALKTVLTTYYADPTEDVLESLTAAFHAANSYIYNASQLTIERNGMGTTCVALVLRGDRMFMAHVGDSRLYLLRNGKLKQISEDHSWVAEQVKRGAITPDEARSSPFRNIITRSLGVAQDVQVDVYSDKIYQGDVFILCSDGLSGYVSDEEIAELAGGCPSLGALRLVERANQHGGGDNITVLIVAVREICKFGNGGIKRLIGRIRKTTS